MKRKFMFIIEIPIIFIVLACEVIRYMDYKKLDIYNMEYNGRIITKDNIRYESIGIADSEKIGKKVGKIEAGSDIYYIYEVKGEDIHNYIIVLGPDLELIKEYANKYRLDNKKR